MTTILHSVSRFSSSDDEIQTKFHIDEEGADPKTVINRHSRKQYVYLMIILIDTILACTME